MKKIIFFLALIFMASVGYMSAQNLVQQDATDVKSEMTLTQNFSKNTHILTYLGGDTLL